MTMKVVGASSEINPLGAGVEDHYLQPQPDTRSLLHARSSSSLHSQFSANSSSICSYPPTPSSVNGDYTAKISGQSPRPAALKQTSHRHHRIAPPSPLSPSSPSSTASPEDIISKTVDFEIKVEYVNHADMHGSLPASPPVSPLSSAAASAASSRTDLSCHAFTVFPDELEEEEEKKKKEQKERSACPPSSLSISQLSSSSLLTTTSSPTSAPSSPASVANTRHDGKGLFPRYHKRMKSKASRLNLRHLFH